MSVRARGRLAAVLVALVGGALLLGGCTGTNAVSQTNGGDNRFVAGRTGTIEYAPAKRASAATFSGDTLGGGAFDLAAQRGRMVVVNFWASWCAPCKLESSAFDATYKSTRDKGVVFVGVNSRDDRDAALAFVRTHLTYPSLFDPAGRIALDFRDVASTLPSTVVIDRQGRVAAVNNGAMTQPDLTTLITRVAAEK